MWQTQTVHEKVADFNRGQYLASQGLKCLWGIIYDGHHLANSGPICPIGTQQGLGELGKRAANSQGPKGWAHMCVKDKHFHFALPRRAFSGQDICLWGWLVCTSCLLL